MRKARLTGELKLIADEIGGWAKQRESIVRLWLFGSHAKSTHSPESNLDIAFEFDALQPLEAGDQFQARRTEWAAELSRAIGLEVQFEPIAAAMIQDAVTDHGILIFEREGAPPCRWLAS